MSNSEQRKSLKHYGMGLLVFLLTAVGYQLTFSYHYDDALTAARELDGQFVQGTLSLVEFRHFVNHLWPYWLLQFLHWLGIHISGIQLIHAWDLITASAASMFLYLLLRELVENSYIALTGAFSYSTAHCIWLYAATGRLYSTSMLFSISAYYLALQMRKPLSERKRLLIALASAASVCFACYFWLVHIFNALGVGILLLLLPVEDSWLPRIKRTAVFGVTGILLTLVVGISSLSYAGVPLTRDGIHTWIAGSGTQPVKFGLQGLMAAVYGQADGVLSMPSLIYVVHGMMLHDPVMSRLASFPLQFAKFLLVWAMLALAYIYPWLMFRRATKLNKILIFALYVPIAVNMFFGLSWLGADVQRFMPVLICQICLASMSVQDRIARTSRPRALVAALAAVCIFMAGVNLFDEELPDQRRYIPLAAQVQSIRPYVRPSDLLITFGKDFDNPYSTTVMYYTGASYLTLTNDAFYYDWDSPAWKSTVQSLWQKTAAQGGRVLVVDRLATGIYPPQTVWSERQHPRPTVSEFASFLRANYCLVPGFYIGSTQYYELQPPHPACEVLLDGARRLAQLSQ